jgi:hypothetical protein
VSVGEAPKGERTGLPKWAKLVGAQTMRPSRCRRSGSSTSRSAGIAGTAFVAEWAVLHEDELAANWERARGDEPLEPIDALA